MERKQQNTSDDIALEVVALGFDDIEAYAYMVGGDVIVRLNGKLLIVKLPKPVVKWDLIGYLEKIAADILEVRNRKIVFTYEAFNCKVELLLSTIYQHGGFLYVAVTPRKDEATCIRRKT